MSTAGSTLHGDASRLGITDSLRNAYVGYLKQPVLVLQAAVVLLLLIACANVAGLLLAQGDTRQKEFATRSALGSTRSRTIRQLVAENVLLSIGGALIGLALAWVGLRTLIGTALSAYPDLHGVTLDWTVLGVAAVASLATGLLFGVLPGTQSARPNLTGMLRESSRGLTASARAARLRCRTARTRTRARRRRGSAGAQPAVLAGGRGRIMEPIPLTNGANRSS